MNESRRIIAAQTQKLNDIADEQAIVVPVINNSKFLGPDIKDFVRLRYESIKQRCRDRIAEERSYTDGL